MVKKLTIFVTDEEYKALCSKKGSRTWRETLLESCGVDAKEIHRGAIPVTIHEELDLWKNELDEIERKLHYIDRSLFQKQ